MLHHLSSIVLDYVDCFCTLCRSEIADKVHWFTITILKTINRTQQLAWSNWRKKRSKRFRKWQEKRNSYEKCGGGLLCGRSFTKCHNNFCHRCPRVIVCHIHKSFCGNCILIENNKVENQSRIDISLLK